MSSLAHRNLTWPAGVSSQAERHLYLCGVRVGQEVEDVVDTQPPLRLFAGYHLDIALSAEQSAGIYLERTVGLPVPLVVKGFTGI